MAELGSIQYEDSRQRTSVRDQNDQRDVLQGIKDVGEAAIEARTEDILGDLQGDLDATTREAVEAVAPSVEEVAIVRTGNPEADAQVARIATLQAQANASTGSTQRRVELELRKQTEQLRNRFPGLRKDIDSEFAQFKATDADYAQLGLSDAGSGSFTAEAARDIERIKTEAYGNGPGQLGMDPADLPFGGVDFAKQYLYLQGIQQETANNVRLTAAIHSKNTLLATELPGKWNPIIQGKSSAFGATLKETDRQWQEVQEALVNPMAPGNPEKIASWNVQGKKEAQLRIEAIEFGLQEDQSKIPLELRDSVEYRAIDSEIEGLLQQTAKYKEAIVSGDPTLMAVYQSMAAARTFNWEADNPQMVKINTAMEGSKTALEFALKAELGTAAQRGASDIASTITSAATLPSMFGYMIHASGELNAPIGADAETLDEASDEFTARNANRNGADQTPQGYRKAALLRTETLLSPVMEEALDDGMNPNTASTHLGSIALDAQELYRNGALEQDAWDDYMTAVASPNVLKYNEAALKSDYPDQGVRLGVHLDTLWDKKETQRLEGYVLASGADVAGLSALRPLLTVDKSKLDSDGIVTFTVDEAKIRLAAQKSLNLSRTLGQGEKQRKLKLERDAIQRAQNQAFALGATVTMHIQSKAHANALKQRETQGRYRRTWDEGEYATFFGVDPAESDGEG